MRRVGALSLVAVAAAVACGIGFVAWERHGSQAAPAGQPPLRRLTEGSLADLREAFNAHPDEDRLLVLLSPT